MTTPINQNAADVTAGNYDKSSPQVGSGGPYTLLSAVAVTTTSPVIDLGESKATITMECIFSSTVAPTSTSTQLQGSEDGVNFTALGSPVTGTTTGVLGVVSSTGAAYRYVRAVGTIVVGSGTAISLTAVVAAK